MPSFTLMMSAGVSRMTRAMKGSTIALPPKPRFVSSTPRTARAATAGQISLGAVALEPWLIELPW